MCKVVPLLLSLGRQGKSEPVTGDDPMAETESESEAELSGFSPLVSAAERPGRLLLLHLPGEPSVAGPGLWWQQQSQRAAASRHWQTGVKAPELLLERGCCY